MSNISQWYRLSSMKITTRGGGGGLGLLPLNPTPTPTPTPSLLSLFTQKSNSLNLPNALVHFSCRCSSKWDSNAESIKNQNFSQLDEEEEEELDEDGILDQGAQVFEEYIESIWIFKVLWSYGWALPPIVLALLVTGGPKAFLMALAIPLGQSTFSFAIQKMLDTTQNKPTRKSKTKKRWRAAPTSSKANFWRRAGSSKTRKRKTGYQSWVPNNDVSASKDDREVSKYGGWDELDQETESKSSAQSSAETSKIPMEKGKLSSAEAKSDTPLLLRLLISMFPFLASWTKLL